MKNNNYIGYCFFSHILKFVGKLVFGGKAQNIENIPKEGAFILAGNHVSNFDCYLLFLKINRPIHIISKKELLDTKLSWFFKLMHIIPVDRKKKNPDAVNKAVELLQEGKIVAIFPEGTFHKKDILLPFKPGAISFAEKANVLIIPFAIKGKFRFRSNPIIEFGNPIDINNIKGDKVLYLENTVKDMLTK